MAITFVTEPKTKFETIKKSSNHTKAAAPTISLDQPGRLRVAHVLSLLGIKHATLYAGLGTGRYPKPDGKDGRMPFWDTKTIRDFLNNQSLN